MVSLERARECIGRPVKHITQPLVHGVVTKVDEHDVWVRMEVDSESLPCIPENLEWDQRGYEPLIQALRSGEEFEDAQIGYMSDGFQQVGFLYSPATANDDDEHHLLYVLLPLIQRVHPARPTVDPWVAYFFEEVLGWATP